MTDLSPPKSPPPLNLPVSKSTVEVHIINTTCNIVAPSWAFLDPVQKGHEALNLPTFAFLITNKRLGQSVLFDLGCRKDWWNLAPSIQKLIFDAILALDVEKGVDEILQEGGVSLDSINAVIWSHWHYDHTGNMANFPDSTAVYVGPGFKAHFMPGYPECTTSPMLASDFMGRSVIEVRFDTSNKIGRFSAFDLFGDGSFYILDVPGHAIGHLSGLARTTPDTFVFMGGDVCHFGGSYRPSPYAPMPRTIPTSVPLDDRWRVPCPCSLFEKSHFDPPNARTSPFYRVTQDPKGWYEDSETAQKSVDALAEFDANDNVLICVAHDGGLMPILDWFPKGDINCWKEKGWKEKCKWGFLNELPVDGVSGRFWIAQGLVKEGKVLSPEEIEKMKVLARS